MLVCAPQGGYSVPQKAQISSVMANQGSASPGSPELNRQRCRSPGSPSWQEDQVENLEFALQSQTRDLLVDRDRLRKDHEFIQHYTEMAQRSAAEQRAHVMGTEVALGSGAAAHADMCRELQAARTQLVSLRANVQKTRHSERYFGSALTLLLRKVSSDVSIAQAKLAAEERSVRDVSTRVDSLLQDVAAAQAAADAETDSAKQQHSRAESMEQEHEKTYVEVRAQEELASVAVRQALNRIAEDFEKEREVLLSRDRSNQARLAELEAAVHSGIEGLTSPSLQPRARISGAVSPTPSSPQAPHRARVSGAVTPTPSSPQAPPRARVGGSVTPTPSSPQSQPIARVSGVVTPSPSSPQSQPRARPMGAVTPTPSSPTSPFHRQSTPDFMPASPSHSSEFSPSLSGERRFLNFQPSSLQSAGMRETNAGPSLRALGQGPEWQADCTSTAPDQSRAPLSLPLTYSDLQSACGGSSHVQAAPLDHRSLDRSAPWVPTDFMTSQPLSRFPVVCGNTQEERSPEMAGDSSITNARSVADSRHSEDDEEERLRRLRQIFERVDLDHDGSLNKRELIKTLRQSPRMAEFFGLPNCIRQEDGTRNLVEAWFQKLDCDSNREISWTEFCHFYGKGRRLAERLFSPRAIHN